MTAVASPDYVRQISCESGHDNPFRPDGDISKEADEIVKLIKSGRPLANVTSPTSPSPPPADAEEHHDAVDSQPQQQQQQQEQQQQQQQQQQLVHHEKAPMLSSSPVKEKATAEDKGGQNGATTTPGKNSSSPATVEVQHATVTPSDAVHAEHVMIKKKSKCNCCVIQ